jgi:hypothetical protein
MSGPREIILHVGPPKTATTTIQRALEHSKRELAQANVHAITGYFRVTVQLKQEQSASRPAHAADHWTPFVKQITEARADRVIFSNEIIAYLEEQTVSKIAEALGPTRLRVVIGIRSISELIPSSWQESLKHGSTVGYEEFLHALFDPTPDSSTSAIKQAHEFRVAQDAAAVAARWAAVLGADRVTGFTVNGRDPIGTVQRAADALGISGLLNDNSLREQNQGLDVPACATLFNFNRFCERLNVSHDNMRLIRGPLVEQLMNRNSGSSRLPVLEEFMEKIAAAERDTQTRLLALGTRIVGDTATPSEGRIPVSSSQFAELWKPRRIQWFDLVRRVLVVWARQTVQRVRMRRQRREEDRSTSSSILAR